MSTDQIVLRNTTTSVLDLPDLGESVDAGGIVNVTYIGKTRRATSPALIEALTDGSLLMIRSVEPTETYWSVEEAMLLLTLGINKTMMHLEKVRNTLHNLKR